MQSSDNRLVRDMFCFGMGFLSVVISLYLLSSRESLLDLIKSASRKK